MLSVFLILFSTVTFAKSTITNLKGRDSRIIKKYEVSEEHASEFGKVVIQDNGRMKPINTFSSELLRRCQKAIHMKE